MSVWHLRSSSCILRSSSGVGLRPKKPHPAATGSVRQSATSSERRSALVIGGRSPVGGGVEGGGHGVEAAGQFLGAHAEGDPHVLRVAEEAAGHDRRVVFDEQPIDEAVDVGHPQELGERDRAGGRRHPRHIVAAGERPLHADAIARRSAGRDRRAGPGRRTPAGPGAATARRRGDDGTGRAHPGGDAGRRQRPAAAQAGQPVRLGQARRRDEALAHQRRRRHRRAAERVQVHFVHQHMDARALGDRRRWRRGSARRSRRRWDCAAASAPRAASAA